MFLSIKNNKLRLGTFWRVGQGLSPFCT